MIKDKKLTENFMLSEFLYSKWFDKRTQALVLRCIMKLTAFSITFKN